MHPSKPLFTNARADGGNGLNAFSEGGNLERVLTPKQRLEQHLTSWEKKTNGEGTK